MALPGLRRNGPWRLGRRPAATGPQSPFDEQPSYSRADLGIPDPDLPPPDPDDLPPDPDRQEKPPETPKPREGIAMWGVSGSGKTTFLAALERGLAARVRELPPEQQRRAWWLRGTTKESTATLGKLTHDLTGNGQFPLATEGLLSYKWELVRQVRAAWWRSLFGLLRGRRWAGVGVPLGLADVKGGYFNRDAEEYEANIEDLVGTLASSAGIIFLFDPIREALDDNAYQHTIDVINRLAFACPPVNGKLPHYVAVCVTKFDDPRVYRAAVAAEKVVFNAARYELPYVPEENAKEFFTMVYRAARQLDRGLPETLLLRFSEDRIKYFVTSAVGFYVDPGTGRFNPDDCANVEEWQDDNFRLRGPMNPINIVDPVIWLAEKLRKAATKESRA